MTKISIITPTEERPTFLKGLYSLLKSQSWTNWEWLIYDTSLRPQSFLDPRVHIIHDMNIISIGEKRNRLVEKATGDFVVHCDDDDYYAPTYLTTVLEGLKTHDFFNIHSWFSYHAPLRQFYYWDTDEESHSCFMVDPITEMQIREIHFGPHFAAEGEHVSQKGKKGYGFSFAYRKEIWKASPFPDLDISEDRIFYENMSLNGCKIYSIPDQTGLVVHTIHTSNLSKVYPQYRIPKFLVESLFSDFLRYFEPFHEN